MLNLFRALTPAFWMAPVKSGICGKQMRWDSEAHKNGPVVSSRQQPACSASHQRQDCFFQTAIPKRSPLPIYSPNTNAFPTSPSLPPLPPMSTCLLQPLSHNCIRNGAASVPYRTGKMWAYSYRHKRASQEFGNRTSEHVMFFFMYHFCG